MGLASVEELLPEAWLGNGSALVKALIASESTFAATRSKA